MRYYTDLFSPETYEEFSASDRTITGFRLRQRSQAQRLVPGDFLVCYVTKLSRWVGLLEIESPMFEDSTPIFVPNDDPFSIRFRVKVLAWLSLERGIPIRDDELWNQLSFTRNHVKGGSAWTGQIRGSLARMKEKDALIICNALERQSSNRTRKFPFSPHEERRLARLEKTKGERQLPVRLIYQEEKLPHQEYSGRESIRIQAMLAKSGERMGFNVWLPRSDRSRVKEHWEPKRNTLLETLPLNYNEATLKTVEQIDVLWLRRRTIVRAFEVEHTTSIYSGILRIADLLALQPNLEIRAHIVAPSVRREKVIQELSRPVFARLEGRPLASACTFLTYDSIQSLSSEKHLKYMSDKLVDEYAEQARTKYP